MSDLTLLAHGVGTRTDLPIPKALALYGSGMTVFVSFLAVVVLWRTARLQRFVGTTLPRVTTSALDSPVLRVIGQALTLALALVVTAVALTGPTDPPSNLAVYAVYVTFWVALVPASLLLGPVWKVLNPLRLLHRGLQVVTGPPPGSDNLARIGLWPAAASLLVFVWLELVYPERAVPANVGVFLVTYAVVQLVAALWFGEEWFAHGDAFEVYSTVLGRLAPVGRDESGRLALRNPLRGVARMPDQSGLVAVVIVLVGSTSFDGLTRTRYWQEGPGIANDTQSGTLGLAVMVTLVAVLYLLGSHLTARLSGIRGGGARMFAHSLVPIAAGYAIAHYFSLLLLDGQTTWILASNPFAQDGVDLFGTYSNAIDYSAVGTDTIAYVQVGAIVLGHVLGVVLAHDRGLRAAPGARTSTAQLPLVMAMVSFTVGGLALLFGT